MIEFPISNFESKAIIEGTPGFKPSMYQHIQEDGSIDQKGLLKEFKELDRKKEVVKRLAPHTVFLAPKTFRLPKGQ